MKRIFSVGFLGLFLLTLLAASGFSQKPADIVEKMIAASGGRKVLEGIKDTTFSGTFDITQMGISGTVTYYHKEPNKIRQNMEFMGMVITNAFDGEVGWGINPQTGTAEAYSGELLEDSKRQALGFGNSVLLHPEKHGITFTVEGRETIEEKEYILLKQTYADGHSQTNYVDPETYFIHKTKQTALNQMGVEVEQDVFFSDYRKVDGVLFPHLVTIYQEGEEFGIMTVTEVKFNTGLEDSLFKMEK
jgi:outer membrane lipoprotein-sorting protein